MAVVDMAIHSNSNPVSLQQIANRQNIPLSYLEQIFAKLKKEGIVRAVKGPGGGYILHGSLSDIKLSAVILAVDGSFKMTRCSRTTKCMLDGSRCSTHDLWCGLSKAILEYFSAISLSDMVVKNENKWNLVS